MPKAPISDLIQIYQKIYKVQNWNLFSMYLGFTSCLVQNFRFRASLEKMLCLTKKVANKNVISQKLYILWQLYLFRIDFRMSALCVQNLRVEPQTERFLERLKFLIFFQNFEKQRLVKVEYLKKKIRYEFQIFRKSFQWVSATTLQIWCV